MRRRATAAVDGLAVAATVMAVGCGRIGYDADADAADATPEPGMATPCNQPVDLMELPVPAGKSITALEVGATTSGFVVVWPIEDAVYVTGFDVGAMNDFDLNQTAAELLTYGSKDVSIVSLGDKALLAVDNVPADGVYLYPLAETGYDQSESKSVDGVHAHGNGFMVAEPLNQVFALAGTSPTNTVTFEREIDAHPWDGPTNTFGVIPENTGIAPLDGGYAVIAGLASECHITAVDNALNPIGSPQLMNMTCHNATVVKSATSPSKIVAAWNCEDDMVWLTGGSLASALPMYHSLYGDAMHSASNPRLAPTSVGVWYGFQVAGGRLGRALVDDDGNAMSSVTPDVVVSGGVGNYNLVSRGDQAFMFWTDPGATSTHLWTMRLCVP